MTWKQYYKKYNSSKKGKARRKRYYLSKQQKILESRRLQYKNISEREWKKIRSRDDNTRLKRIYGIGLKEYDKILKTQKFKCAICRRSQHEVYKKIMKFNIDHDHKTGKIRGLLCTNCNRGLGFFKDDIKLLQKSIKYLITSKK